MFNLLQKKLIRTTTALLRIIDILRYLVKNEYEFYTRRSRNVILTRKWLSKGKYMKYGKSGGCGVK